MTVENGIKLLKAYKAQMENPVDATGRPLTGGMRRHAISQSTANYENMKKHILTSKKYQGHPIVDELQDKPKEPEVVIKTKGAK